MTEAATLVLPEGSMPLNAMKEEISKGYIQMVASAAGLTILRWDTDYGAVDLSLKSYVDYGHLGGFQPSIELQLKATAQDLGNRDDFAWSIDRRTHEKLTHPHRNIPAFLTVLALPEDPALWLNHDEEGILARTTMYWVRAAELPSMDQDAQSVTVRIPKSNRFGPTEVLTLMEEASRQWL